MNMQSLIPWNRRSPASWTAERDPFMLLHDEMNRLFDSVSREFGADMRPVAAMGGWPKVDVTDSADHVRVDAELPGLTAQDVDVTLKDGVLTLSGERKVEKDDPDRRVAERFMGRFARQIPLGYDIDEENVTAQFDNGELTVTLPKAAQQAADAKRIEVEAAA